MLLLLLLLLLFMIKVLPGDSTTMSRSAWYCLSHFDRKQLVVQSYNRRNGTGSHRKLQTIRASNNFAINGFPLSPNHYGSLYTNICCSVDTGSNLKDVGSLFW